MDTYKEIIGSLPGNKGFVGKLHGPLLANIGPCLADPGREFIGIAWVPAD